MKYYLLSKTDIHSKEGENLMKKTAILLTALSILSGTFLSAASAEEIKLQIKDFKCTEEGKMVIHYGIINTYNFEYNNVTLGFKVMDGDKTVLCRRIKTTVPKEADGSETNELIIDVSCTDKHFNLESAAFYYIKQYKIDEWFTGCEF